MSDFHTSTHRAKWIFSSADLMDKYISTNQRATQMLEKYGTTRLEVGVDGSILYNDQKNFAKENVDKHSRPKPLGVDDERLLRVFYEGKIQEVCAAFRFPHKIQATALIYFKRFYLQWSVMEHHPKNIMLTCIYASCKIEENHVSAEELGKGIEQDHQVILNNEMIVYQSLDFDLIVYAPYRSVEGYIIDLADFLQQQNGPFELLRGLHDTSREEVDKSMLTDALLLFPPGQLALAAIGRSNQMHKVIEFEGYLGSIISRQHLLCSISELSQALHAIDNLVRGLRIPATDDMKHIDRKLRSCLSGSHDNKKRDKKSKHKSRKSSDMQNDHTFVPL